jgi:hypothetical protein
MGPPSIPGKAKRRWLLPAILFLVITLPLAISLIWYASYRISKTSAVNRLEARIRARGEPLTLADVAATYPPIRDEDNGALVLTRLWEEDNPELWRAFREGKPSLPERRVVHYDRALPFFGAEAMHMGRTEALSATNRLAAENYLKDQQSHLETVRQALQYPHFRFPIQLTNGYAALLPHLTEIKEEATKFRILALCAADRGDVDGAISAFEDIARCGQTLASEPTLISQLVRIACYRMVLDDLERLLSGHVLNPSQLERVDSLLDQFQMKGALRISFIMDRATDLAVFDLSPEGLSQLELWGSGEEGMGTRGYRLGMGVLTATGLKDADRLLILETLTEGIALADRDDPDSLERCEQLFPDAAEKAREFPPRIFSAILLPALGKATVRFAGFEARRRAAKTAIAVERYRLAHAGKIPEDLATLVPEFQSQVLKDPFDGESLRFHPLEKGFVVYSIGVNRIDDEGKEPRAESRGQSDETFVVER